MIHQEQFVDFMNRQFNNTIQNYEQEISERPEEEKYDGFYHYTENLKESYSEYFLKSGFILSYSTMELILKEFCQIAKNEFKIGVSWQDDNSKKSDLFKLTNYLRRKLDVKIDRNTFKILDGYRITRNLIVHELGGLKTNKNDLDLGIVYEHNSNFSFANNHISIKSIEFLSAFSKLAYETLSDIENELNTAFFKNQPST